MQKSALRILSCFLAMVVLFLSVLPFQAVGTEYVSKESFWNWVASSSNIAQGILSHIPIGSRDNVCANSDDGYHHSNGFIKDGQDGYFRCVCKDCGQEFRGYASDLASAYDDYVETLPAPEITQTSLYTLYFRDYVYNESALLGDEKLFYQSFISSPLYNSVKCQCTFFYNDSYGDFAARSAVLHVPVSGAYRLYGFKAPSGLSYSSSSNNNSFCLYKGTPDNYEVVTSRSVSDGYILNLEAGDYFAYISTRLSRSSSGGTLNAVLSMVPLDQSAPVSNVYLADTRPTSIIGGNYGIVGDNGQITKVEDNSTIINETNNTFYNPATGTTVPIVNWSYDYSDRSYKVTLESGDTSTITYGDEYITIKEGDTIYNVYYLIDGSGSVTPPCEHDWQETNRTDPTCTRPGSVASSCTKCQQTKTEPLPALGHDWKVKQTVTTQYDETGQLIQEGYTIFECSTCHEQYKSTDGTAPPGGSGTDPGGDEGETIWDKLGNLIGSLLGGLIGMVEAVLGKILDALIALAEGMMERLKTVVEAVLSIFDELPLLFGGFLDFLAAVFPFLPPELMTILTFGILAVVFIGILKAVRR